MIVELDVAPVINAITRALEPLCDPMKTIEHPNWGRRFRVLRGVGKEEGSALICFTGRGDLGVSFRVDLQKAVTTPADDFIAGILIDVMRGMDHTLQQRQIVIPNSNSWLEAPNVAGRH